MLDVRHRDLKRTIKSIIDKQSKNTYNISPRFPIKIIETKLTNIKGREFDGYILNEQAYLLLAMRLTGYEKAEEVQLMIVESFSMMKQALLNSQNNSWIEERKKTKAIRHIETDTIKDFVGYATEQGSKKAKHYYANITKMTNKALELLIQIKDGKPIRDLADVTQLGFIMVLDNRATQTIKFGMENNLPYKYIYQIAKEEVNKLADSLCFKRELTK